MFRKLRIPVRIQLLVIALSLSVTTSVLGLSAYLTDTETYQSTFRTAAGKELGFELTGTIYEDFTILPGDTIQLDVIAKVNQPNSLYLFVQLDVSPDFTLNNFNSNSWKPIEEKSNIYYYGTTSKLSALGGNSGSSSPILESITLPTTAKNNQDYFLTITGYAIQSENIPANASPKDVFLMIGGPQDEAP